MSCPLCGDICRCSSENKTAPPRWLADAETPATSSFVEAESLKPVQTLAEAEPALTAPAAEFSGEGAPAWRNEVAARLNRYQARRKPRPPRYPSLQLRFEEPEAAAVASNPAEPPFFSQRATVSNQALALDSFADTPPASAETVPLDSATLPTSVQNDANFPDDAVVLDQVPPPAPAGKLIEFPRSWTPTPPPLDELAEPVVDRPRILEAPEFVPPAPALGGITIESVQQPEIEKRPGIDIPLQSAPLARRILAAAIDGILVTIAGILFGFVFWKLTAIRPPRLQIIGLAAGLPALFWAAYQYLLLVYSGSTAGLRLARLELARFDGTHAGRRTRRWRVLASFLSAASLGMGYAWVFLDEDALCWHDRITHTYLAPRK